MSQTDPQSGSGSPSGTLTRLAPIVVVATLLGAAAGVIAALMLSDNYSATTTLLVEAPSVGEGIVAAAGGDQAGADERRQRTNAALLDSTPVHARAVQRLDDAGVDDATERVSDVEVDVSDGNDLAKIIATAPSRAEAARVADEYAEAYLDVRRASTRARLTELARSLDRRARLLATEDAPAEEIAEIRGRAEQLRALGEVDPVDAQLVQRAVPPADADDPEVVAFAIGGGLAGLLAGLLLALGLGTRTARVVADADEAGELLDVPVLAEVPRTHALAGGTVTAWLPGAEAEAYRMLRANLRYLDRDRVITTVLVTSPGPGEGKSTVAFHLAATVASAGAEVLLLEADLRRPVVSQLIGLPPGDGLSELLLDDLELEDVVREVPAPPGARGAGTLDVIPAGFAGSTAGELLDSERMRELMRSARERYRLVVIDTPPVSIVSDAIPLLDQVDGVIAVIGVGRTSRDNVTRLRDTFRRAGAPLVGVVANFVPRRRDSAYEAYMEEIGSREGTARGRRRRETASTR